MDINKKATAEFAVMITMAVEKLKKEVAFDMTYEEQKIALLTSFSALVTDLIKEELPLEERTEELRDSCYFFVVDAQNNLNGRGVLTSVPDVLLN